jgi:dipeptidase E
VLRDFADGGLPIYGGSAGAILLGRDIDIAQHVDSNDVGLSDTTGLDLALSYAISCHYMPADDSRIRDYVGETGHAVLALPERGGLARTGETMLVVGPEPAKLFGLDSSRLLERGSTVPVA